MNSNTSARQPGCRPRKPLQTAVALLLPMTLSACALAEQYRWDDVPSVVAVSDPHGDYAALLDTLRNAGVLDAGLDWSGDDAHLVVTGDLLDRGPESRKIMDLIMRLEKEAAARGGMVHLTLGNHEVMNLVGDLRYVSAAEYAAFAGDESKSEREQWFQVFKSDRLPGAPSLPDDAALRREFDAIHPPGFFAHRQAFGSEGKYGRWLLARPVIIVINDTAFVHGGLPDMVAEQGLEGINARLVAQIVDYVRHLEVLHAAGVIDPTDNFNDHPELAQNLLADAALTDDVRQALLAVVELNDAAVHSSAGPLWYRGTVGCGVLEEGAVLANALAAIGAERVVVGHTPTVSRQVLQRFAGKVIEIDTGMLSAAYQGSGNALIIDGDILSVVNEASGAAGAPKQHLRRVGLRAASLSAANLARTLTSAAVDSVQTDADGRKIVTLSEAGTTVNAVFNPAPRKRGTNTELAAYRLDLLLGLDMVPVTVAREIEGVNGTLQYLPNDWSDETRRSASGSGGSAWCPLPRQWNSMYIFDALIHNEGRPPQNMAYSSGRWQLLLMDHTKTFGTQRGIPDYLEDVALNYSATWVDALTSLTDEQLRQSLGDVLDKRQLRALGKRRDFLLREASKSEGSRQSLSN